MNCRDEDITDEVIDGLLAKAISAAVEAECCLAAWSEMAVDHHKRKIRDQFGVYIGGRGTHDLEVKLSTDEVFLVTDLFACRWSREVMLLGYFRNSKGKWCKTLSRLSADVLTTATKIK